LLGRADAIMDSLDDKDTALILNALNKFRLFSAGQNRLTTAVEQGKTNFLTRLSRRRIPTLVASASAQNLVLMLHAMNALDVRLPAEVQHKACERIETLAKDMDAQQVALAAAAMEQWGTQPSEVLIGRISELVEDFSPKGLMMVLEALVTGNHAETATMKVLVAMTEKIDRFDARGCALILNCLAKANLPEAAKAEIFSAALGKFGKFPIVSLRELALVTNASVRRLELNACADILGRAKIAIGTLDVQSAALLLNALAKCGLHDVVLVKKFLTFSGEPTDAQRAMMLHALGKVGISDFRNSAESLVAGLDFAKLPNREFFMTLYGLGRLRLIDASRGEVLLKQLKTLLAAGVMHVDSALFLYRKYLRPAGAACSDLEALCLERRTPFPAAEAFDGSA
jgi:hypothetical protein